MVPTYEPVFYFRLSQSYVNSAKYNFEFGYNYFLTRERIIFNSLMADSLSLSLSLSYIYHDTCRTRA